MRLQRIKSRITLLFGLLCLLFFVLFPFSQMFSTAFKSSEELFVVPPTFLPQQYILTHFIDALDYEYFLSYFTNSLMVSVITCIFTLVIAVLAAYAFTRLQFPGKRLLLNIILMSQMFCLSAVVVPLYKLVSQFGLINTHVGLVLAYLAFAVPVAVWLLRGFMMHIPPDLEESAMMEGATKMQAFFKVVLPLLRPGMGATAAYVFFLTWQEFLFALVFMTKQSYRTLPIGILDFKGQYETNWGTMMAASILIFIPVFILFMFIQKQLIAGLTEGATKG